MKLPKSNVFLNQEELGGGGIEHLPENPGYCCIRAVGGGSCITLNNCSFRTLTQAVSLQYRTRPSTKAALEGQRLSSIHLESDTRRKEAKQTLFARATPSNTTLEKGINSPSPRLLPHFM